MTDYVSKKLKDMLIALGPITKSKKSTVKTVFTEKSILTMKSK